MQSRERWLGHSSQPEGDWNPRGGTGRARLPSCAWPVPSWHSRDGFSSQSCASKRWAWTSTSFPGSLCGRSTFSLFLPCILRNAGIASRCKSGGMRWGTECSPVWPSRANSPPLAQQECQQPLSQATWWKWFISSGFCVYLHLSLFQKILHEICKNTCILTRY